MNTFFNQSIEYLGYVATALVIISLMMKSLVRLRLVNMLGGILFLIYSIIIGAYPVVFLNGSLVLINAYFLFVKRVKTKTHIDLLHIQASELEALEFFQTNKNDIEMFFGTTDLSLCNEIYLLLKNEQIVGIFAGNRDDNAFEIKIDYVSAPFRDYKIGTILFQEYPQLLLSRNIRNLFINTQNTAHQEYIVTMGFSPQSDATYTLALEHVLRSHE